MAPVVCSSPLSPNRLSLCRGAREPHGSGLRRLYENVAARHYPQADSIRLVQDNLNTHTPGSFYAVLSPAQAFALAQKFELHYTPKKGSWLNMAEIEFAALSKQCLDRRIPEVATLRREVLAWADCRNQEKKTVQWKFAPPDARQKLHRHYEKVQKLM